MNMSNIPRRKIYEKMLEYEDIILELHILLLSEENFKQHQEKINKRIPELKEIYKHLKVLFILFLKNSKFEKEEEYTNTCKIMLKNEDQTNKDISKNKILKNSIKESFKKLDYKLNILTEIKTLKEGKELYKLLDQFNSEIPKMLEIRRDIIIKNNK